MNDKSDEDSASGASAEPIGNGNAGGTGAESYRAESHKDISESKSPRGEEDGGPAAPEGSGETKNEAETESAAGRKKERSFRLRSADEKELRRVVAHQDGLKSVSHLVRSYLHRSLLPRIEKGRCYPGRLAAETAGMAPANGPPQTRILLGLEIWDQLQAAAQTLNARLRRQEERRAWTGGARAFPFRRCGPLDLARAAAREIAVWSRGGPPELFSQDEAYRWVRPGPNLRPSGEAGTEASGEPSGPENSSSEDSSTGAPYQVLAKLPGRQRGGKPVQLAITEEAKEHLKRKGARLGQTGTDLARRATRLLAHRAEEAPAEALEYIAEESDLYQSQREGRGSGFQIYVSEDTKRRLEQARTRLRQAKGNLLNSLSRQGGGRRRERSGPGEWPYQRDILQAAARWAIEAPDEEMLPPLPAAETDR